MPTYVTATPLLLSMATRAAYLDHHGRAVVQERIDGRDVVCIGRRVQRNSLDGFQPTVMVRWQIDGQPASRRQVYESFGERAAA